MVITILTVEMENDNLIGVTNPMPFEISEIAKLKKERNNITLTYSTLDEK